jgi:3-deoxy-manno-octulosonate cytidylyltransferase (CMP-KDO synthetase)
MRNICIAVPARENSTRLPKKLLLDKTGKPLIQYTLENLQKLDIDIWLVTDSMEIREKSKGLVAGTHYSNSHFESGTERISQFAREHGYDWVINVQGDEPEIDVVAIKRIIESIDGSTQMITLGSPFKSKEEWRDENSVKLVRDKYGNAIYFTRQPVGSFNDKNLLHHIGVYAYQTDLLLRWNDLEKSDIEVSERLEQLRAMHNNVKVKVLEIEDSFKGIDTKEDYEKFVSRML